MAPTVVPEYLKLTKKYKEDYGENTVVFMQVGSFFEVYGLEVSKGEYVGSNIADVHRITDLIIAHKAGQHPIDGKAIVMSGFQLPQLEKYVKKMQECDYTCVIYTQDGGGKNAPRIFSEIISPGTFFSEDTQTLSNTIMCIWFQHIKANKFARETLIIGCATIDILTGKTTIFEINIPYYHNPCTYNEIEKLVSVYHPNECIVISNLSTKITGEIINFIGLDDTKLHIVDINHSSNTLHDRVKKAEKQVYQFEIFKRFYPNLSEEIVISSFIQTHCLAVQAFVVIIDFVHEHCPSLTTKLNVPIIENHTDKLILANHSLKQLNILDDERHSGKLRSVCSFLNSCLTMMGKREFMYNLHHPITNKELLKQSYEVTEQVLTSGEWETYRRDIKNIHDLDKLKRKIVIQKAKPYDMAILFQDCVKINEIAENASKLDNNIAHTWSCKTGDPNVNCKIIMDDLEKVFDIEKCLKINDLSPDKLNASSPQDICFVNLNVNGRIDSLLHDCINARNQLEEIAKALSGIIARSEKTSGRNNSLLKIYETVKSSPILIGTKRRISFLKKYIDAHSSEILTVSYMKHDGNSYTVPISLNSLSYQSIGSNKKDESVVSKLINSLTSTIQKSQDELIFELISFFKNYILEFPYIDSLHIVSSYVTQIDMIQCKAYIASSYNYCKPNIIDDAEKSFVSFTGIRHPLIEHLQTNELYVTNDLTLGDGENCDGILLFGTNAVGKTSLIKSVGIAIIMAQAGLYVPCKQFEYSPYNCIYTRILGNDNLFKGLSTFAVEMSELLPIITLADENSLILGDELCSGTDSSSALSIFSAGLERLHGTKSTFLFATHFHEIVGRDEINSLNKLKMMHMEVVYDQKKDELIYGRKLKEGAGDSMYGLEVCKSLNYPKEFLERSHELRIKYNPVKQGVLSQKGSHFNAKKLSGNCEICRNTRASEIHHLRHQTHANRNQYIESFHKNHPANLIRICTKCHHAIHHTAEEHKVVKTTNGYKIMSI